MPLQIIRNDITKVHADAIVNTANPMPVYGAGTDAAIYRAAGEEQLLAERDQIGTMSPGEVSVTGAYGLPAKYILHTVGPSWIDGSHGEFQTLASCYRKSLHLAEKLGCESIAFPLIATGVYRFPKDKALQTALREIRSFLDHSDMSVTLVVFSREAYRLSSELTRSVRAYIDDHYYASAMASEYGMPYSASISDVEEDRRHRPQAFRPASDTDQQETEWMQENALSERSPDEDTHPRLYSGGFANVPASPAGDKEKASRRKLFRWKEDKREQAEKTAAPRPAPSVAAPKTSWESVFGKPQMAEHKKSLEDVLARPGETFQQMLLRKMAEKNMTGPEVYKKANLDKKLFSKIRTNPAYTPKKQTAVALAIALRLNLDETVDLIGRAGLALSPSNTFDLIITFCIENKRYDVDEVNSVLFEYDQPLLGC